MPPDETKMTRASPAARKGVASRLVRRCGPTTWVARVSSRPSAVSTRLGRQDAGVVDEHVDLLEAGARDVAAHRGEVGDVHHCELHPGIAGGAADLVSGRLGTTGVAAQQVDRRAALRQRLRGRPAEPGVAAGDETDAPRQVDVEVGGPERAAVPVETRCGRRSRS